MFDALQIMQDTIELCDEICKEHYDIVRSKMADGYKGFLKYDDISFEIVYQYLYIGYPGHEGEVYEERFPSSLYDVYVEDEDKFKEACRKLKK